MKQQWNWPAATLSYGSHWSVVVREIVRSVMRKHKWNIIPIISLQRQVKFCGRSESGPLAQLFAEVNRWVRRWWWPQTASRKHRTSCQNVQRRAAVWEVLNRHHIRYRFYTWLNLSIIHIRFILEVFLFLTENLLWKSLWKKKKTLHLALWNPIHICYKPQLHVFI